MGQLEGHITLKNLAHFVKISQNVTEFMEINDEIHKHSQKSQQIPNGITKITLKVTKTDKNRKNHKNVQKSIAKIRKNTQKFPTLFYP